MSTKLKASLAVLVALGCLWFYFTPHLAVRSMQSAAEAKDAAKFSGYVNFPALRENVKGTLNAKMASEMAKQKDNAFAAFGTALATTMVNQMVDSLVTPESLTMMMQGGKTNTAKAAGPGGQPNTDVAMGYEGFDRFVVNVKPKNDAGAPVGLVFSRDGMFSWRLTGLRVPM